MGRAPVAPATVSVFFAQNEIVARNTTVRPAFAIVPDHNTWNDYGFRFYANFILLSETESHFHLRIMFAGHEDTAVYLTRLFEGYGPIVDADRVTDAFCSFQADAISYQEIVRAVGFDAAVIGLRALHDVVLANLENEDQDVIALTHREDFHVGMIRSGSRYTAYRRGGRYIRPQPRPEVEDSARTFTVKSVVPSSSDSVVVTFDFEPDSIFEDRVCVLIGRNGVGKTQLLSSIINGLTDPSGRQDGLAAGVAEFGETLLINRTIVFSSVFSDPYPRDIAPWHGIDYEYFAVAADKAPLGPRFMTSVIDCMRNDGGDLSEGEYGARFKLLEAALTKLGLWEGLHVPLLPKVNITSSRSIKLIDGVGYFSIAQRLSEQQENKLVAALDRSRPAIILSSSGTTRQLSSGELAMAQFAAQISASIEKGSIILLDEPETHLHPNYVSEFMDLLQDLLSRTHSIAIIATHSAYVLREVPRQRVNVLRHEDAVVFSSNPRMQTFGANLDDLSRFVFFDGDISPRYSRQLQRWAQTVGKEMGLNQIVERYGEKLSPVTLSLIARSLHSESEN